ncbi:dedicator of cytokinesis protein 1-like isoform X4 [Gigantopelta aegis]|uniref:dedicator of cytokinesis protein 1-like isoform X4 n=1 Tax=Gigantopelta aegis TaxID=1735272 RepID=UPI001B887F9F|nr:dedicator of cytokinesis protein 1-like isoform X4 [Gigantopelta aegis]
MTIWRKSGNRNKVGVAVYNYRENGPHRLSLDIGDTVVILEETDEWYRGYVISDKTKSGIFPKSYIHTKETTVEISGSRETITVKELPIVTEMTLVLKEWHSIWKQIYVTQGEDLDKISEMINELVDWRRKILSHKLTNDELKALQQDITARIDYGNALLNLDLVVRDELGNVLNPEVTSVIEVHRRHCLAAERIRKETQTSIKPENECRASSFPHTFNLFVMLRNFVCKIGEDADILMNLFDAKEQKFISENFLVKWSKEGVPKDIEMLNNFRVVFTDLGTKDRLREKVFLVFQIVRIGVMDPKDADSKKQTQGIRRPFGVAAMEITDIIQGRQTCHEDQQFFIPFQQCGEKEFMENVIKKVIVAKEINHKGQGLWVSMIILPGDMKQVHEDYPHLVVTGTPVARKMGFPEVILPVNGDVRNDIYVTLMYGEFTKGPTKTTDKNVEVSMVVCNSQGDILQNVISHGCGQSMMSEYKSMIYYHEDKPKWYEIVKVAISTEEDFRGLHLKFQFKHKSSSEAKDKSERPFAMSFVKLLNEDCTTLKDCTHELIVYKIESKKAEDTKAYFDLPSCKKDLELRQGNRIQIQSGAYSISHKDYFFIESYVCSTKLTHNVDLLGLLKWREILNDTESLKLHLQQLMKTEGEEIVKFLQDLLDSLFNILMQNTNSELCEDLVFDALVYIIALISDRKYNQFRPVLDAYIESFGFTMAYNKLMFILKDYVDKANEKNPRPEEQSDQPLLRAMKSLEYIFKIIIRSRLSFSMINEGRGKEHFANTLKQLIQSISNMMMYTTDHTLLVQGAALKYISSIIAEVITVFDPLELSHLMVQFINSVPKDRLTRQKMKCVDDLIHTALFKMQDCRLVLLGPILQHTMVLMEHNEEMEDCINVMSDIMATLWAPENGPSESDLYVIMQTILRTVIQSVIGMDRNSKIVSVTKPESCSKIAQFFGHQPPQDISYNWLNGNCVAVMMSILRQMTENHYVSYINSFTTTYDVLDFLMEIILVFRDLISRNVYPEDWVEMILLQNSVMLRALRFFASTIHEKFSNPFEQQLWNNFFHCSISFLTQDSLQLEHFSGAKREKIIAKYKDMRRETGFEIRSMWFNLGHNKINFIPAMVGPILEMTLIPETELRKATIPIFFDMMLCEFNQPVPNSNRIQGNFHEVENEMITQLDALVEGGRGDEQYMDLIFQILYHLCDGHSTMQDQGLVFVETVRRLLQRLLEYRLIMQDEIKEHRMSCIVNLLDFYHDINRKEMYIRYLHKLCDLHLECDNFTEAAHTLLLYSRLLQWSDDGLPPMLNNSKYSSSLSQRELKEKIYYDIISNLDKGKMWETGIEMCKELARMYEEELFDYKSLSTILKRQAELFDCIMNQMRPEPEYFRVGYFGRGFPSFLQNKVYIYRGKEYERLADFSARMQTLFPNAELMKTLDAPGQDIVESQKQYLQINAVSPVMELKPCFCNKPITEQILKYYRVNEVQKFTYSRRTEEGTDVSRMWLERTIMVTSYPLPGIVGWYPVTATETYGVSPLECAIETIEKTNKKLTMAIDQHRQDPALRIDPLGMLLNGVVDPAVNGGISKYKVFYNDEYLLTNGTDKDRDYVERLKQLTTEQISLLRDALLVHRRKAPETLKPFHTHMEQRFAEMCTIIEREYGIKVSERGFKSSSLKNPTFQRLGFDVAIKGITSGGLSLRRNHSMPVSADRHSEVSLTSPSALSELNYATPTKTGLPAGRSQSVWVKADKVSPSPSKLSLQSKMGNIVKRVSQVGDQFSSSGQHRNSFEQPIELNEQKTSKFYTILTEGLTTRRPPRPDSTEKRQSSRPPSNQFRPDQLLSTSSLSLTSTQSGLTLTDTSDGDFSSDEPPPLPEKHSVDYSNISADIIPAVPRKSISSANTHKNKPVPALPEDMNGAMPPVLPSKSFVPDKPPVPEKPALPPK